MTKQEAILEALGADWKRARDIRSILRGRPGWWNRWRWSLAALYVPLHQMEVAGLVESRWGEWSEARDGCRPCYYRAVPSSAGQQSGGARW